MKIAHLTAELAPLAKVGGLGDVLFGLSRALIEKKIQVEVILPKYDTLDLSAVEKMHVAIRDLPIQFDGKTHSNTIWKGKVHGIDVIFIETHDPYDFFKRGKIYGFQDDPDRFAYFSLVALQYLSQNKTKTDILHLHDWHLGIAAPLKRKFLPSFCKTIFTIHNLSYRGISPSALLKKIDLIEPQLQEIHDSKLISFMKGGVLFSDYVTTVSPTYAKEILAESKNDHLCRLLELHKNKFKGILNGIDNEYWNPKDDPHLPIHFTIKDLKGKKHLQNHLRKTLSLAMEDSPLVGCVTRLVYQKGPELIKYAILRTLENGGQFVLIGSTSDDETERHFSNLKKKFAGNSHVHMELNYNEDLSHLAYAGCDLFVVPSIFEPCGLTQMIAMRYGTIPLVRKTGGLADTVVHDGNGFVFNEPTAEAIGKAIDHAFEVYQKHPEKWSQIIKKGMEEDFSWDKPAAEYIKLYHSLTH